MKEIILILAYLLLILTGNPLFLTRNNATIQVNIVKLNDYRYSLVKPSIKRYMHNINEINKINKDKCEKYKLADLIKKIYDYVLMN